MWYLQAFLLGFILTTLANGKPYSQNDEDDPLWDTASDDTANQFASFVLDDYSEFRRRKRDVDVGKMELMHIKNLKKIIKYLRHKIMFGFKDYPELEPPNLYLKPEPSNLYLSHRHGRSGGRLRI